MPTPPLEGGSVVENANYTSTATRPPMRVVVVVEKRTKLMETVSPYSPVNVNLPLRLLGCGEGRRRSCGTHGYRSRQIARCVAGWYGEQRRGGLRAHHILKVVCQLPTDRARLRDLHWNTQLSALPFFERTGDGFLIA